MIQIKGVIIIFRTVTKKELPTHFYKYYQNIKNKIQTFGYSKIKESILVVRKKNASTYTIIQPKEKNSLLH